MKPLSQEWIDKAEGDCKVVEDEWKTQDPVNDVVCFLAQQCVEKYLKAWLSEQTVAFSRTHDLEALGKLALVSLPEIEANMKDLIFLTSSAVEIRYPGASANATDADKSRKIMLDMRVLLRSKLGI